MTIKTSKVHWREWSEATFADAKAQDKPVLLGISAVWCHWCHVMDRGTPGDATHTGTYSADDIAGYINQNFIPVRVDNDQRPDINARYNMGGWPTTCFLTPDGDVIYGGTYFAPSQMRGLLQQVLQYWTNRRDELEAQLEEQKEKGKGQKAERTDSESLIANSQLPTTDIVSTITNTLIRNYDKRNGGLGGGQKFPMSDAWELLLAVYAQTGEEQLLEMVS
ncbi:MAG: thioredoxin domain-containing protein, partial [Anaerolineae bacterium]|nr:thioredoxin domain-containing protein [Anaerolineae bacterium]